MGLNSESCCCYSVQICFNFYLPFPDETFLTDFEILGWLREKLRSSK